MIVPLVTPFASDDSVDVRQIARVVEYVAGEGADGLMPTALTGEGLLLSDTETLAVWDAVFAAANSLPVAPAVIRTTTRSAVDLVRQAERRGAAAAMVAPLVPELYAGRALDDVYDFYAEVAAATALPLILFNYPSLTGVDLAPSFVARLAGIPNVQYIKESTGDSKRLHSIQRLVGSRIEVICGSPAVALESLALGCRAWITGIMNAAPRSASQLLRSVRDGTDLAMARDIYYRQLLPWHDLMHRNSNPTGTIKAGLRARGLDAGAPRRPGREVSASDQAELRELVAAIAILEARAEADLALVQPARRGALPHN
jgi:4-hydroxy-tetrahydrodipicolinate synthase